MPQPDHDAAVDSVRKSQAAGGHPVTATSAADFALIHRPSFTLRKKIALSFLLCFLVIGGVTFFSYNILVRIESKLYFLELADRYTADVQQARRYEKNFFLYGTDLDAALDHIRTAHRTFAAAPAETSRVVGRRTFEDMLKHLERYQQLLERLYATPHGEKEAKSAKLAVEPELREHGAQMVEAALRVAEAERQSVLRLLKVSKLMPVVALGVLLLLIVYITIFLTRQILRPIGRMVAATGRIAQGDFSPLRPQRKYRDEFTSLSLAINHMLQELNQRQEMLAEAQKLRAIGTLTAGIAHELNNPVNNISLTAEALVEDGATLSDEERVDMCHDLLSQAERAQGVVRNLLDFSRQREVNIEPLQLDPLLGNTTKLVRNQMSLAQVKIELCIAEGLPPVRGDRPQLSQVFVNIYLNAIDAMSGGGLLKVTAARADDREGFVRIDVTDSGTGIPEEAIPYVFDPFFSTKGAKGTGLGLSVSYGIIAKHGGTIVASSRAGQGTTFSVFLPAEPEGTLRP
jgi:two-component system NtrC family sensor kinase